MNVALLVLRVVVGGLFIGHGSQKLFGWFGGHGPKGTATFFENLGLRPALPFALLAGYGGACGWTPAWLRPLRAGGRSSARRSDDNCDHRRALEGGLGSPPVASSTRLCSALSRLLWLRSGRARSRSMTLSGSTGAASVWPSAAARIGCLGGLIVVALGRLRTPNDAPPAAG